MSIRSYTRGFVKAAMERNVDPMALAKYAAMQKSALDTGAVGNNWRNLKDALTKMMENADKAYSGLSPAGKGLVNTLAGAGVGALGGTALGGAFGRPGRGAWIGAAAGAGTGALASIDYKAMADKISEKIRERRAAEQTGSGNQASWPTTHEANGNEDYDRTFKRYIELGGTPHGQMPLESLKREVANLEAQQNMNARIEAQENHNKSIAG